MKRGLVFSLCALAALATSQAQAQNVDISLNLRYTNPADPAAGGQWFLMAQASPGTGGIAGISAYIANIDTAAVFGNPSEIGGYGVVTGTTLGANVDTVGGTPFSQTLGGAVNVVYGQDNSSTGAITLGVGDNVGMIASDPLRNSAWDNSALIMSGTFGALRPEFVTGVGPQNNETGANVFNVDHQPGENAVLATVTTTVRGDSLASFGLNDPTNAGLLPGDANRDFAVDALDFNILADNFNDAGTFGWDDGNFDGTGGVDALDFNLLADSFNDPSPPNPQAAAVPEPASFALIALGVAGVLACRRRML